MSVYVDPLLLNSSNAHKVFANKLSCHMYADSVDELHEMADVIGLKRSWFQEFSTMPHYDLVESKRVLAIENGAIEQNRREAVNKWKELKVNRIETNK